MSQSRPEIDETARAAWVERILAAPLPADALLAALEELDARQDLATQAALYESVLWRADVRHYWSFFRLARVYAELGREDASFQVAALALQMHPEWDASFAPFQVVFRALARRGDARGALDVFLRQVGLYPENPIAQRHEVEPLLRALGVEPSQPPPAPPAPARAHRVFEAESRPPSPVRAVTGMAPHGLARLSQAMSRDDIDVIELPDGELLVCNDTVVVCDSGGGIRADLSVGAFPGPVAGRVREPEPGVVVEQHEAAEAVLLLDAFPPPNLCHFLLDQVARLELYRRAGADLAQALVVGPELRTRYQQAIAKRAGVARMLGAGRLARVRARRLWVSTDCRALQHPAHHGAAWAVEHTRALLGGRGAQGSLRLYISRADAPSRQVQNEAALLAALEPHGFRAIVPGALPYQEQLAAFRDASHVVGAHGAALAHIVLCPPGARVLELFHPLYGTWAYAMLAASCGLDYAALVGRDGLSDAPELNDPALVDLTARRFGERHLRIDPAALELWLAEDGH